MMILITVYYIGTAVIATVVAFILHLFVRFDDNRFKQVSQKIPGPPRVLLFGNTFQFIVSPEKLLALFDKWVKEYGYRYIYRVGTYWIVALCEPRDVEKILTSTTETVKSVDYDQLIPWLGTGLLISNKEKWAKRRKLLTPAFHFKILEKFLDVFNQQSFTFVDIIKGRFRPAKDEFDVTPLISKMTLDIICETAMGVKINAQMQNEEETEKEESYISAIARIKFFQQYRAFRPWLEASLIWNLFSYGREEKRLIRIAHEFTNKIIQQRKLHYLNGSEDEVKEDHNKGNGDEGFTRDKRKRTAFLDLLLEAQLAGELESDEDVREETDTFMFEGHDTVSSGLAFTLFLIGSDQNVQIKVHGELDTVFGDNHARSVTMEDLGKLKYLECCVKESLRLLPSVPIIARSMQNDFQLDDGVVLPRDTLVLILPYQLHRNPEVYPNPLDFKPERFLQETNPTERRDPFAYVPFSAGPRNCIGQKFAMLEEKVTLANIFRRFRIESTQKLDELTLLSDLILHSKDGIKLRYYLR